MSVTARDWIYIGVTVYAAILVSVLTLIDKRAQRKRRQREQQKKLDQQNNIGRRIYNALDRYLNRRESTQFEVIMWDTTPSFVVQVNHPSRVDPMLEVSVNMTEGESEFPIRVRREGKWFVELWPTNEAALEELIPNLQYHFSNVS